MRILNPFYSDINLSWFYAIYALVVLETKETSYGIIKHCAIP